MQIVTSVAAMQRLCKSVRQVPVPGSLGLVPTMGALHKGHLSLVRAARKSCDTVAVSIFVNPLQFGPNEDLAKYPRTFSADCDLLEQENVDILFAPSPEEMYPAGAQTFVDVPEVGGRLDGGSRPGHFRGVATVVSKLFHIASPNRAFFGQKDAAQVAVLRTMVRDMNFDLEIIVCPTVRDADGLALSSRNRYLSSSERAQALALPRALETLRNSVAEGGTEVSFLREELSRKLQHADGLRFDYAEIVDPTSLEPVRDLHSGALVAIAAWVGNTRLIDNLVLPPTPVPDLSGQPEQSLEAMKGAAQ